LPVIIKGYVICSHYKPTLSQLRFQQGIISVINIIRGHTRLLNSLSLSATVYSPLRTLAYLGLRTCTQWPWKIPKGRYYLERMT